MKPFEVVPHRVWAGPEGRTASIYGASPWGMGPKPDTWHIEERGFTLSMDNGTLGFGRPAFKTRETAQRYMDAWLADDHETRRAIGRAEGWFK